MARSATPPEPSRSSWSSGPATVPLPARIDRASVGTVVARCLEAASGRGALTADGRELLDARLAAVDALARVALAAARDGRPFRLEHASPELLELLRLCGLDDALRAAADP